MCQADVGAELAELTGMGRNNEPKLDELAVALGAPCVERRHRRLLAHADREAGSHLARRLRTSHRKHRQTA